MTTLYESILSSTKSGANAPLTLDYLLKRGYKLQDGATSKDTIVVKDGPLLTHVLHYRYLGEKLYIWVRIYKYSKFFHKWIETIKDLELVESWWKCHDENKSKAESDKVSAKIMKQFYDIPHELKKDL